MISPLMRYFMAVAQEGSIRQAAVRLHIAASAVNRHILEYESQLGSPLFDRLPRGVRLTDAGKVLYETCKRMGQDYEDALSKLELIRDAKWGHVSIGTLQLLAEDFFPPLLSRLLTDYPGITYSFTTGTTTEISSMVVQGEVDVGLTWEPMQGAAVRQLRNARVPFGVALPVGHPLAARDEIRLQDCRGYPLAYPALGELRDVLHRLNLESQDRTSAVVQTQSMGMLRNLVVNGDAIAITSLVTVGQAIKDGKVEFRPLKSHSSLATTMCAYVRAERTLPPAVALVAEQLTEAFPDYMLRPPAKEPGRERASAPARRTR